MLATLVIGLREGLEAALIVGIIAAFLRKNGESLVPMWVGVTLAAILSLAVGIGLKLSEKTLSHVGQETMEAVIGVVAVFFVTWMIVWMNAHARDMRRRLEAEASEALNKAGGYALAGMAFLAVLREGFETSVFLLATFSVAQSAAWAVAGAVVGLLLAIAVGWGVYAGGAWFNLSRFFRVTAGFLILVAAGLIVASLRDVHEAGWLNAGQRVVVDLSWLVAPGSVHAALLTGMLGIPADPRLVEVVGWLAYLVPVAFYVYWPLALRPEPRMAGYLKLGSGLSLAAIALGLALFYPPVASPSAGPAPIVATADKSRPIIGKAWLNIVPGRSPATLNVSFDGARNAMSLSPPESGHLRHESHNGVEASVWSWSQVEKPDGLPSSLTFDQVIVMSGGRTPVGLSPRRHPGPFDADWRIRRDIRAWTAEGQLLDATERGAVIVILSGGGMSASRTLTVKNLGDHVSSGGWRVLPAHADQVASEMNAIAALRAERRLWAVQSPVFLAVVAFILAISSCRALLHPRRIRDRGGAPLNPKIGQGADKPSRKGIIHGMQ